MKFPAILRGFFIISASVISVFALDMFFGLTPASADPNGNSCPQSRTETDTYVQISCFYQQNGEYQHFISWDLYYGQHLPSKEDIENFAVSNWLLNDGGQIDLVTSAGSVNVATVYHSGDRCTHSVSGSSSEASNATAYRLIRDNTWDYIRFNFAPHGRCGVSGGNLSMIAYKSRRPGPFTLFGEASCGSYFTSAGNKLSWTEPRNMSYNGRNTAEGEYYHIYRNDGPGTPLRWRHSQDSIAEYVKFGPTARDYTDTTVETGKTYTYRIWAQNPYGTTWSNEHSITSKPAGECDVPSSVPWLVGVSECQEGAPVNGLTWQWNGRDAWGQPHEVGTTPRTYKLSRKDNSPGNSLAPMTEIASFVSSDGRGSYIDRDVNATTLYLYQIMVDLTDTDEAVDIVSPSSFVELVTATCNTPKPPPTEPRATSVRIEPLNPKTVPRGTIDLTATCFDQNGNSLTDATVGWVELRKFGSITPDNIKATYTAPDTTGYAEVEATCTFNGEAKGRKLIRIDLATGGITVTGDIFAGGNVANIDVDQSSVVSATGTIENVSTNNTIANYTRDTVEQTEELINTIVAEKAQELPVASNGQALISGTFNLNPKKLGDSGTTANNDANPEGGVWHVAGDLLVQNTTFSGRGTIVVDGNVTLLPTGSGGEVKYANDQSIVGIIARGNASQGKAGDISISGFSRVVGAFYAPRGTIRIGENITVPQGLFVGNTVELGQNNVSITYDGRITKNPPLGFSQSFTPSISEVTP